MVGCRRHTLVGCATGLLLALAVPGGALAVGPVGARPTGPALAPATAAVAPLVRQASPIVHAAAPVLHSTAPVGRAAEPVTHSATPVIHAAAPVIHAAAPVVHTATPVVRTLSHAVAPVVRAATPALHSVAARTAPPIQTAATTAAPAVRIVSRAAAPVLAPVTDSVVPTVQRTSRGLSGPDHKSSAASLAASLPSGRTPSSAPTATGALTPSAANLPGITKWPVSDQPPSPTSLMFGAAPGTRPGAMTSARLRTVPRWTTSTAVGFPGLPAGTSDAAARVAATTGQAADQKLPSSASLTPRAPESAGGGSGSPASAGAPGAGAGAPGGVITELLLTLAAVLAGRRLLAGRDSVPPAPFVQWVERPG